MLHFNRRTYAEMLRMTLGSLARLNVVRVVVKPHPRALRDRVLESALAAHPSLPVEVVRKGDLQTLASRSDCVVSFFSSAGVEAAMLGVPVVQVLPPGSGNFLPPDWWNLAGSARSQSELDRLLARVLSGGWSPGRRSAGRGLRQRRPSGDAPRGRRDPGRRRPDDIGPREPVARSEETHENKDKECATACCQPSNEPARNGHGHPARMPASSGGKRDTKIPSTGGRSPPERL